MAKKQVKPEVIKETAVDKPQVETKVFGSREFKSVKDSIEFTFEFPNGKQLVIHYPQWLYVSPNNGSHRIITRDGWAIYVYPSQSWFTYWMKIDENADPFTF